MARSSCETTIRSWSRYRVGGVPLWLLLCLIALVAWGVTTGHLLLRPAAVEYNSSLRQPHQQQTVFLPPPGESLQQRIRQQKQQQQQPASLLPRMPHGRPPPVDWSAVPRRPPAANGEMAEQWVVVTSVHYPTAALKRLAALPGWRVVVVGDTKTPGQWSWRGCDYLSLETQMALGYSILRHVPLRSYARKNVGYLYAIEHGARVIYETDDDNELLQSSIVLYPEVANVLQYKSPHPAGLPVVNPYGHFGAHSIWPRGFPLELIEPVRQAELNATEEEPLLHGPLPTRISIQQGLADLDPDVDAIFRLTRGNELKRIRFDRNQPAVALPRGLFCPFNSQNTVWHGLAFWGLLIPVTTTFRVCDIWRGYWAQRLLWDVGGHLAFLPPTAVQDRNAHDYLEDFVEEQELYLKAGKLVTFLAAWRSGSPNFFDRVVELSWAMVDAGFWYEGDAILTQAWLHDLLAIGYQPPPVVGV